MIGLNRKKFKIYSPVTGKVIELEKVNDVVFSQKLVGDGVAIEPISNIVVAPCHGVIKLIFKTNHAFALVTDEGLEIIVHIGIDTIDLKGEGFTRIAEEDQRVKPGDEILRFNKELLESKGCDLTTMVLITNFSKIKKVNYFYLNECLAGEDIIIEYTL
jgi:glucose-specific phosphotransferase system IIA component